MKSSKVMVFGVFDGLHPGHLYFLKEAGQYGMVTAVVARDKTVKELKNKTPLHDEKERVRNVLKTGLVEKAVLGDKELGSYEVIKKHKPDLICFGYDQTALEKDLKKHMRTFYTKIKLIRARSYKPDELHSSLLKQVV